MYLLFYSCKLPNEYPNASYHLDQEMLNQSFPWNEQKHKYSNCSMIVDGKVEYCSSYIYDHSKYESSAYFEVSQDRLVFCLFCGK